MDSRREDSDLELTEQSEWNEDGHYVGSDPIGVFRVLWFLVLHCIIIPGLLVAGALLLAFLVRFFQ